MKEQPIKKELRGFAILTKSGKRIQTVNSFPDGGCPWHDPIGDSFALYPDRQRAEMALEKSEEKGEIVSCSIILDL